MKEEEEEEEEITPSLSRSSVNPALTGSRSHSRKHWHEYLIHDGASASYDLHKSPKSLSNSVCRFSPIYKTSQPVPGQTRRDAKEIQPKMGMGLPQHARLDVRLQKNRSPSVSSVSQAESEVSAASSISVKARVKIKKKKKNPNKPSFIVLKVLSLRLQLQLQLGGHRVVTQ